jgi:hypothetical protein
MSDPARASFACAPPGTERFGKLLRLALVADQPGEIVAAVCALKRALAVAGLDAHAIVDAFERGAQPIAIADERPLDEEVERSTIWWCYHHRGALSAKERRFVESLIRWRGPISDRQRQWLHDIAARLHTEAA